METYKTSGFRGRVEEAGSLVRLACQSGGEQSHHKKDRHDDSISYNTSEEILDDIAEQDLLELLSLNDKMADHSKTGCREDIKVSNVDSLTVKKAFAYDSRDRIRDLIDLTFIVNNCLDLMRPETQDVLIEVLSRKGLEQLDYLLRTQGDLVSDKLTLKANFLSMFEKLELL